jgi:hypothetical protein
VRLFIGIICLSASLFYGMTAAEQRNPVAVWARIVSAILFALSGYIWLFHN